MQTLIDAVQEVVSIIRQFSSLEWESIADDAENFGDYINNTYLTKAFGKRILDYVLLLLLKHAKEVFLEDILALADTVENLVNRILEELREVLKELAETELAKKARELAEEILRYKAEILAVMSLIQQARAQYDKDAKKFKSDTVFVVPVELATRLEQAWKRLYELAKEAFPSYFSLVTSSTAPTRFWI